MSTDLNDIESHWRRLAPDDAELTPNAPDRDDDAWRDSLSGDAYRVLRREGTEPSFSHPLNDEKREGLFVCAGCGNPLFSSAMKFDSGTGWPSFFTAIPGALDTKRDFKLLMPRTEYHCAACGGHQGHVFKDGPPPTSLRYCNNGLALTFLPSQDSEHGAA